MKYVFSLVAVMLLSFVSLGQGYNLVGNSTQAAGDCFILTQPTPWQNGAIWYDEAINITEPFNLQFTASFGTLDAAGADGMVFVMQQVGNDVIGVPGGGMGFEGFSPSLGVEFDSFQNVGFGDPVFDHMAISTNGNPNHNLPGNLAGPVPISPTSGNVEDGQEYIIDISWEPSLNQFTVSVNCEIRLQVNISLQFAVFPGNPEVFWGFTGATGGEFNEQRICLDPFILGLPETFEGCVNEPVQLEAPPAGFGTVSWEPAEFLDDPTSFSPIATVDEDTEFTLTFEDLCGNVQTQETMVVVSDPSIDLGADISGCEGDEIIITAMGDFDDISWSDDSNENTLDINDSGTYWADVVLGVCQASDTVEVEINSSPTYVEETNIELCEGEEYVFEIAPGSSDIEWFDGADDETRSFDQAGTYPFVLSQGGCSADYELEIEVTDLSGFNLGPDITECQGGNVILTASGTAFEDIVWSDNSQSNNLAVTETGTYWADVFTGNCEASDTVEVLFNATPVFNGETDADICEGEEFTFDLGAANYDILWFDGAEDETRVFDQTGVYPFELIDGECTTDFQVEVDVTLIPEFELGPDLNICEETSVVVIADAPDAEITWSDGSSGTNISVSEAGIYWALANNNGCTFSDTLLVTTSPVPSLELSGIESLCPGEEGLLTAVSNAPIVWSTGDSEAEIVVTQPGLYSVLASNEDECSTQKTIFISGLSLPRIDPIEDLLRCQEEEFILVSAESSDDINLEWSDGSSGGTARIKELGTITVELTNECGTTSRSFQVGEEECFDLFFLPNAFTPDGDGLNDLYKPVIDNFLTYELLIYNRNGELVFESNDPNEGWNGSFQNNEFYCPAGVYAVRYSIDFGENVLKEGFATVVLVR
ncbi:gliding motility-associated C-terminal domain-containing protein [Cryomorphaceae bacterium 1068]|nr:gliding motility-associated C-terminal domain-containing protein [Cryomorphaceae bacterium 1068]